MFFFIILFIVMIAGESNLVSNVSPIISLNSHNSSERQNVNTEDNPELLEAELKFNDAIVGSADGSVEGIIPFCTFGAFKAYNLPIALDFSNTVPLDTFGAKHKNDISRSLLSRNSYSDCIHPPLVPLYVSSNIFAAGPMGEFETHKTFIVAHLYIYFFFVNKTNFKKQFPSIKVIIP